MASLRPLLPVRRCPIDPGQVPSALAGASHVFLRVDAVRRPLTAPYDGPFLVLDKTPETFKILKNNKPVIVSIDRVKPAFVFDSLPDPVRVSVPAPAHVSPSVPVPERVPAPISLPVTPQPQPTRYGRLVHAPDRLQL